MAGARIRILPEETVNRVAAGEVVERPAAALKELLENAVDAGARRVEIDLEGAGRRLIRVADDGAGMAHDDALLALERHATSKIGSVEDLERVGTYGFRGEALPSIAAVSRLRLTTRARGEEGATRIEVDAGRVLRVAPCGAPEGTEVEVRDLFRSVPARLKFLRTDATELGHCLGVATRLALARTSLALTLRHGSRPLLRLPPAGDAAQRLRDLHGAEFVAGLVPVRAAAGGVSVEGFVSRPGAARPGAEYQQLFVNARPVREPLLAQGIREASRDWFEQEKAGPSYFLWIDLPAGEVDVNVHPTKREVRFRDLAAVRRLVAGAIADALREDRSGWLRSLPPGPGAQPVAAPAPPPGPGHSLGGDGAAPYAAGSAAPPALPFAPPAGAPRAAAAPEGPLAGQLFETYLVTLLPDRLVLTDQHAAHERILYERILAREGAGASQLLLEPVPLELSAGEGDALEAVRADLAALGVEAEPIGPRAWRIRSLPPELPAGEAEAFVRELLAAARDGEAPAGVPAFRHRAAALLACHGAVRAARRLSPAEAAALLADLARTGNPGCCPHGRPTAVTIDRAEIERRFKRT